MMGQNGRKYLDTIFKRRSYTVLLIAFASWIGLLINQARGFINNPALTEGKILTTWSEAFNYMFESTVIINLVVFLFPLSYILLVFGLSRRYNAIETVPTRVEATFGIAIMASSFLIGFITTLFKPTSGGYGVTDYLVFLFGLSYLFFGYDRLRSAPEKKGKGLLWQAMNRIDITMYFIIAMEIIYIFYQSRAFETGLIKNLETWEAWFVGETLRLFGYPVTYYGNVVSVRGINMTASFTIDWGCTGIISITIYSVLGSALVLAVPAKPWKKLVCIAGGVVLLFFANLLRLITIVLLGYYQGVREAMEFHTYGGYVYFLTFVGIYWFITLNFFLLRPAKIKTGEDKGESVQNKVQDDKEGNKDTAPTKNPPDETTSETAASTDPLVNAETDAEMKINARGAKKFGIDVVWVFSTIIVSMIVGFVLKIMIGNHYGLSDLGIYYILLVLYTIAYTIGELGVSATITKFVAEHKDKPEFYRKYASVAFLNSLLYGVILACILFALSGPLASFYGYPKLESLLRIISIMLPFLAVNNTIIGTFNGLRQMSRYGICGIFRRVIVVVYTGIFILAGLDLSGAVLALVLAEVSNFMLVFYYGRKMVLPFQISNFRKITKKIWRFSPAVVALNVIGQIESRIDLLILAVFVSSESVGIYSVAVMLAWLLPMVPRAVQTITYPMMSRYHAKDDKNSMEVLINTCLKYSLILMAVAVLTLIFIGNHLLNIFFTDYRISQAYPPMIILACGLMLFSMVVSIGSAFLSIGKPEISLKISLFVFIPILVVLNLLLIPGFWIVPPLGIIGAAIATSTAYTVNAFVNLFVLPKQIDIPINWKNIAHIITAAVVSGTVIYLLQPYIHFIAGYVAGLLIFVIFILYSGVISRDERHIFMSILRRDGIEK